MSSLLISSLKSQFQLGRPLLNKLFVTSLCHDYVLWMWIHRMWFTPLTSLSTSQADGLVTDGNRLSFPRFKVCRLQDDRDHGGLIYLLESLLFVLKGWATTQKSVCDRIRFICVVTFVTDYQSCPCRCPRAWTFPRGINWQQLPATLVLQAASQKRISVLPNVGAKHFYWEASLGVWPVSTATQRWAGKVRLALSSFIKTEFSHYGGTWTTVFVCLRLRPLTP